jgi:hypothetical protein
VAVWLLSLLPSLVGVLSPDATLTWTDEFNDVPILLVALMAIAISRHGAEEHGERVFWGLLMGYPGAWLVARVLYLVVPYNGNGILSDQVTDLSYLVGYLCVVLALEFRPRLSYAQGGRAHPVERLGVLLYGFFLLSYFTLAPSIFRLGALHVAVLGDGHVPAGPYVATPPRRSGPVLGGAVPLALGGLPGLARG